MKESSLEIYTKNIEKYTRKEFLNFLSKTAVEITSDKNSIMDSIASGNLEVEYVLTKIENLKSEILKSKIDIIVSEYTYTNGKKKLFAAKEYPLGKEAHKVAIDMNKKIELKWKKTDLESEVMIWLLSTFILVKCNGILKDNIDNIVQVEKPYQVTMGKLSLAILRLKKR